MNMASSHIPVTSKYHTDEVAGVTRGPALFYISRLLLLSLLLASHVVCTPLVAEAEEFDWRNDHVISHVSDSRPTGDSAPFVLTEGVESLMAIDTEQPLVNLSRQQAVECCGEDLHPLSHGYACLAAIGGLCPESAAQLVEETCAVGMCPDVVKVTGTENLPPNREDLMLEAIHKTPLCAALDASHESFKDYKGGIYSQANCSTTAHPDHMVQIVGYGTTAQAEDYWIIKNSWGTSWGQRGYMKIVRGQNMCGIASRVFYPNM